MNLTTTCLTIYFALMVMATSAPSQTVKKPVYIQHTQTKALASNPSFREYLNLHGWFYYPKKGKGYDITDGVSTKVFRKHYLNSKYPNYRDRNHPTEKQLQTLDIEGYRLDRIDDPNWGRWTTEVRQILQLMKSTGREVIAYGVDGDQSIANYWTMYRLEFVADRPDLAKEKVKNEQACNNAIRQNHERLGDLIDVVSVVGYSPYWIPSAESWECDAFIYQLEQRCKFRKSLAPDKPLALWLQPNITKPSSEYATAAFDPMPKEVWERICTWALASEDVDRIIIFTKSQIAGRPVQQPDGWLDVLKQ